jgi:glycerol-3-phosphate acyltransferase PlsY
VTLMGWFALLVSYLIGGIPFGLILHRISGRGDIRKQGSGNIGATNVLRSGGRMTGVVTLLLDALKGASAVWLTRVVVASPALEAGAAFAAVLGHCYPVYLGFKGGKGIATGCGAFAVLAPVPTGISLGIFAIMGAGTRIVSVGSITAGLSLPLLILWWQPNTPLMVSAVGAVALAVGRHHQNIRRIFAGRESRIDEP